VDWNSARAKLIVAGPILIVLGLVLYVVRGDTAVLVFPVIGVILLITGVIWELFYKPRQKKPETLTSGTP
jgi:uncharacterized membrane protein HdeD (DUF308 family)